MRRANAFFGRGGERGNTTIEFAIIAPTFLLLLMAVFELGYMVFVQAVLDNAARDAARLIRTGQVQTSGNATQTFQTLLCSNVASVIGCGNIIYQAQVFATWSAANTGINQPPQKDLNGNLISVGFTAGTAKDIVAVQVTYNYAFFTTWIAGYLGSGGSQTASLMPPVVSQKEPFPT